MSLRFEFENTGSWLFRYRSFLPLLTAPLFVAAFLSFDYLGGSEWLDDLWDFFCFSISLCGLGVRMLVAGYAPRGTSGRNTHKQIAQVLNTTGLYSLVRHPLYLGNFLIVLGVLAFFHDVYLLLLVSCLYALYYERIMFAEERYLKEQFHEAFEEWSAVTPAIWPKWHGWKQPEMPYSWRTVLRREYTAFFGITLAFSLLEVIGDSRASHALVVEWPWVVIGGIGTAGYLVLRALKKHTRVLQVAGR